MFVEQHVEAAAEAEADLNCTASAVEANPAVKGRGRERGEREQICLHGDVTPRPAASSFSLARNPAPARP